MRSDIVVRNLHCLLRTAQMGGCHHVYDRTFLGFLRNHVIPVLGLIGVGLAAFGALQAWDQAEAAKNQASSARTTARNAETAAKTGATAAAAAERAAQGAETAIELIQKLLTGGDVELPDFSEQDIRQLELRLGDLIACEGKTCNVPVGALRIAQDAKEEANDAKQQALRLQESLELRR